MQNITHYKMSDDGSYTAIITGLQLTDDEIDELDKGNQLRVDVNIHDPYKITEKQRRKIFVLCNDIEDYTGTPSEFLRNMFKEYVKALHMTESDISLSHCSKKIASDIIDVIMQFVFTQNIPLKHKTSDLMKQDNYFIYLSTINRQCVICGKPNSDLAHKIAIGKGRNRKTMQHYGNEILALCREHHNLQHDIGLTEFNKLFHLEKSWIKVTPEINKKLKGGS